MIKGIRTEPKVIDGKYVKNVMTIAMETIEAHRRDSMIESKTITTRVSLPSQTTTGQFEITPAWHRMQPHQDGGNHVCIYDNLKKITMAKKIIFSTQ